MTRPDGFQLDRALQTRLNVRCQALSLKDMPGFAADAQGNTQGNVLVEYAPWKTGRW
ncbi:hypothetical protein G7009_00345 [Pseudomonas capeferrum]|uniref:hypothetical protein n=1 Tax=Pseudomonas capeferrum TaxID=1495066 RepID=UPI0015E27635|nr:hypothetical protein [Pseudomonas capeferrum]MBA1200254.1 hypothetical protein [Pseudomonas capeferrum]